MDQSLLTGWIEPAHINNKGWVLEWLVRLNPAKVFICGSIDPGTGAWRFEFPDQVQALLPNCEIIYRPYATDENTQWKTKTAKQWVTDAKAHLQGRRFRVTFCCEPDPSVEEFPAFMKYSAELMGECHTQDLKVDMWGIPAQHLQMFTSDPRSIDKGAWNTPLFVAGELPGTVLIDIHGYGGFFAPAGTYDDAYMREIISKPDLLRDESSWATYEMIESRPYQTRWLFRDMWLNRWTHEIKGMVVKEHDLFSGESIFDYFGDDWDVAIQDQWRRANAIAGGDLNVCVGERHVGGIRTLPNVTKFKLPNDTFKQGIIKQLRWHGNIRARNPRYKGWALYMLSDKEGDQAPHNWLAYTDILDACVGLNMVTTQQPTTQPAPVVVVSPVSVTVTTPAPPTVLFLVTPKGDVNVRAVPDVAGNPPLTVVHSTDVLKVIAPASAREDLGIAGLWLRVITPGNILGWVAAHLVNLYPPVQPVVPTWKDRLSPKAKVYVSMALQWQKNLAVDFPDIAELSTIAEMATLLDSLDD